MAEKRVTKLEWYDVIRKVVEASDHEAKEGALEFIDAQKDALKTKAAKAAEAAAKKKKEGDELREKVHSVLTGEYQTIDQITWQVEDEGVTKAKVTARLTQLVKAELAEKDMVKAEDGRKVTAYRLVGAVEEAVEQE